MGYRQDIALKVISCFFAIGQYQWEQEWIESYMDKGTCNFATSKIQTWWFRFWKKLEYIVHIIKSQ